MTKMHDQRAEAIARITAVRDEVLAREAAKPQPKPKVAKPIREMKMDELSAKKREERRKWKQAWRARNPEKAKEMKAKERKRYKAAVKARMEADPEYREQQLAHRAQWPCRQNRTTTNRETRMTDDHKSILDKIKAGEADMGRYMTMLDDIKLEETALAEGDSFVINAGYSHLVHQAVADDIAERRAAVEWKFKRAAIAVWMYRTEANRRGLL